MFAYHPSEDFGIVEVQVVAEGLILFDLSQQVGNGLRSLLVQIDE